MAKAKKETVKKEFAWDTEVKIGGYGDAKERHEVRICTLNGATYIQDSKEVKTAKGEWKRTKGNTMKLSNLKELMNIVGKWELEDAFSGVSEGPKLAAKQTAKGAAPVLRGVRKSVREKLAANKNFGSLEESVRESMVALAEERYESDGMVSVAMSKTNFSIVFGKGQIEAASELKAQKGFSRAEVTFLA